MIKKVSVLLLVASIVIATGCSGKKTAANDSGSDAKDVIKVGFTVQDLTNEYFVTLVKGIEDHQDQYGMEVLVHDAKSDATSQVTAIENFITQEVDAIVICPIDPVAPENAVKEAEEAGIPVISWSEYVNNSSAFLTLDQHQYGFTAGTIAGNWIKDNLASDEDANALFVYIPEVTALAERGHGLIDGVKSIAPNINIVAEQSGNTPEAGMAAAETVLINNPDLNVIVCGNDAAALGAYEAMAAAGKKGGDVCIVGLDANSEAIKKIKEGGMYVGTVDIGTYQQGTKFLDLVKLVLDEGPQDEPQYVDFIPVTSENIDQY